MAEISKINVDGIDYNIRDKVLDGKLTELESKVGDQVKDVTVVAGNRIQFDFAATSEVLFEVASEQRFFYFIYVRKEGTEEFKIYNSYQSFLSNQRHKINFGYNITGIWIYFDTSITGNPLAKISVHTMLKLTEDLYFETKEEVEQIKPKVGEYQENAEWLYYVADAHNRILFGSKTNGQFYALNPNGHLSPKVDREDGKSLIDATIAKANVIRETSDGLYILQDKDGKILQLVTTKGMSFNDISSHYADIDSLKVNHKLNLSLPAQKRFLKDNGLALGKWCVPNYYNNYLANKVREINAIMRSTIIEGDAFYFITDTHWEFNQQHSPALIKEMNRILHIPRLFHGGDVYGEGLRLDEYGVDCINELRHAIDSNKVYESDGNHEYISMTETFGDTFAQYRLFLEDVVFGGKDKNYFYTDNKEKKIRYIVLASYGAYINNSITWGFEDAEQINWFKDVALDVEQGWDVIIFCHYLTSKSPLKIGGKQSYVNGAENIYEVVNNYQGNGNILAFITGHTHCDCISLHECKIPVVCTTCDHNRSFQYTTANQGETEFSELSEPRIIGTITEQAFDIVNYDKKAKLLHFCRIGSRAMNRTDHFDGNAQVDFRTILLETISVGTTKQLNTILSGNVTWESTSDAVSVNNGTISAFRTGSAVINAINQDGEIQSFFIRII